MKRNKIYLLKRLIKICAATVIFLLAHNFLNSLQTDDSGGKCISSNVETMADGEDHPTGVHLHPNEHKRVSFFRNTDKTRKDWHEYEFIEMERERVGVGEQGDGADFSNYDPNEVKRQMGLGGFNGVVSDNISLNRSLPDVRHPE